MLSAIIYLADDCYSALNNSLPQIFQEGRDANLVSEQYLVQTITYITDHFKTQTTNEHLTSLTFYLMTLIQEMENMVHVDSV